MAVTSPHRHGIHAGTSVGQEAMLRQQAQRNYHPERAYLVGQLTGLARTIEQSHVADAPLTPTERAGAIAAVDRLAEHLHGPMAA